MSNGAGGWRGQPPPMEERKAAVRAGRGRKLVGLLALFLAIAATVVGFIFFIQRSTDPVFQSLAIREYSDGRLPVNAWAIQDGQLLEQRFGAKNSYAAQTAAKVMAELNGLRRDRREPVVLHLCALARVIDGKVYLLPGDADPQRAATMISLDDVLTRLRDCPAPGKLLILDIMRPMADARLGIYTDDVSLKTQEALEKAELNFYVLCACSAGQTSQVSQELGQSVFAYYLDQGLAGHADGHGSGRGRAARNRDVTVKELAEFVTARVDRWAWQNRGVRQTPALYGKGVDFTLWFGPSSAEGTPPEQEPPVYPPWLRGHWAQRDKWQPALSRLGPGLLRHLEAELLRAEQRWRGGDDERAKKQLDDTFTEAAKHAQRVLDQRPPLFSLRAVHGKAATSLTPELRKLLFLADNPALKDEKDKMAKDEFDKAVKDLQAKLAKTPRESALAIFDAAAAPERLPQAHFLLLHRLLVGLEFKPAPGEPPGEAYPEVLFLDRLKFFADRVQKTFLDWPAAEVHHALVVTQLAETIAGDLLAAPALWPWVAKDLEQADLLRRNAEKALLEGFPPWADVERQFRDAAALYREVQRRMNEVNAAQAQWERALRLLPNLAPVLTAQGKDHDDEPAWNRAVAAAASLGVRFRVAGASGPFDGVAGLRQALNDLEQSLSNKEEYCLSEPKAEDYAEIEALLRSPLFDAARREKLWKRGQALSLELLAQTKAQDDADNQSELSRVETPPPDRGAAEREERRRRWRGREALALVTLAGLAGKLDKDADAALQNNDAESWRRFAEIISNLWPGQAVLELENAKTGLARVDVLTRLLAPSEVVQAETRNPALAAYGEHMAALLRHLAARGHAEAANAGGPFRTRYAEVAEAFEHEALRWRGGAGGAP